VPAIRLHEFFYHRNGARRIAIGAPQFRLKCEDGPRCRDTPHGRH
jgi:hypothetical protein